jgi:hypothetical protein
MTETNRIEYKRRQVQDKFHPTSTPQVLIKFGIKS